MSKPKRLIDILPEIDAALDPADIRKARRARRLTQRQLAKMLGVPVNTVARWERGERTPTGLYAKAVGEWLGN